MVRLQNITDEDIISFYQNNISYKKMIELTGLTQRGISHILNKHNISKTRSRSQKKYFFDENYFDIWSNDMAWILGLLITDGCIYKNNISFYQKDERILNCIKKIMKLENPIKKAPTTSTLTLSSKLMVTSLARLGIGEKKSLTVPFPNVPFEFLPSFIRGVIDGDGWVHHKGYVLNVTTGSLPFANGLSEAFESLGFPSDVSEYFTGKNTIYRVWIRGKENIIKISSILYKDCGDNFVFHKKERMHYHLNPANFLAKKKESKEPPKPSFSIVPTDVLVIPISENMFKKIHIIHQQNHISFEEIILIGYSNISFDSLYSFDETIFSSKKIRLEIPVFSHQILDLKKKTESLNIRIREFLDLCILHYA